MAKQKRKMTKAQALKLRKKRKRRRIILLVIEVLVLLLLLGALYVFSKYDKIQRSTFKKGDIKTNEGVLGKTSGYTTIALFGGDSRNGALEEGTHTDCIIVASINNKTKEIKLASIYRDTLLDQTDGSLKKANNAYFVGGPKQAINMMNLNLDLSITDYVTVDFKALSDTIDLLGGVEIEIKPEEIKYANEAIEETARIVKGKANYIKNSGVQMLDGIQATSYARVRKTSGGDFVRSERQRIVIEKIMEKVQKTGIGTLTKIVDKVFPQVSTSLELTEVLGLAKDAMSYKLGETEGFPQENQTTMLSGSARGSVVVPVDLQHNVIHLHEFLYGKKSYQPSAKIQEISNQIVNETGFVWKEKTETGNGEGAEGNSLQ